MLEDVGMLLFYYLMFWFDYNCFLLLKMIYLHEYPLQCGKKCCKASGLKWTIWPNTEHSSDTSDCFSSHLNLEACYLLIMCQFFCNCTRISGPFGPEILALSGLGSNWSKAVNLFVVLRFKKFWLWLAFSFLILRNDRDLHFDIDDPH